MGRLRPEDVGTAEAALLRIERQNNDGTWSYFGTGGSLEAFAELTGEPVSRYRFHIGDLKTLQKQKVLDGYATACVRDIGGGGVYEILGTINSDNVKRGTLDTHTRRLKTLHIDIDRATTHAAVEAIIW